MHLHWQDLVLATCILGFNLALIPTLISKKHQPHVNTGLMTAFFQIIAFVVYINLHLWYSAVMGMLNALLWLIIVMQGLAVHKPVKRKR